MTTLPAHDMGPAANAFRKEVRDWLARNWTAEKQAAHLKKPFNERGYDNEFSKLMGRDGWIGVGWPKQFGGQGRSPAEQITFITEMANAGAPAHAHTTSETIVAQALFQHGTKEQQDEWLPAIKRGERLFALGYSEPEAGSDLAALRSRAVRDGDHWVVNGQKLWSTGADKADHMWLAVRTDPEAKKHAGISVLMVDLKTPGITIRPSMALYGKTFSAHFYDDVRVPAKNMVGAVNTGWKVITDALAAERVMIGGTRMAALERAFDHLTEYLKTAVAGGKALKNDPVIRDRIGALAADLEVARQFQMRNSRLVEQGRVPLYEAAMGKVFASECLWRTVDEGLQIAAGNGYMCEYPYERAMRDSRINRIFEGTNDVLRLFIALTAMNDVGQELRELAGTLKGVFNDPIKGFGVISEAALRRAALATGIKREGTSFTKLHTSLTPVAAMFEEQTRDLATATDRILRKHGKQIIDKQFATRRLADIMIDLFVLACVLSRVDAAVRGKGEEGAKMERHILDTFAGQVRRRIKTTMAEIDDNEDESIKALADHAFDLEKFGWDTV